jgi:hypothetical protein
VPIFYYQFERLFLNQYFLTALGFMISLGASEKMLFLLYFDNALRPRFRDQLHR